MNTLYGEFTRCDDCVYFENCDTKTTRDGCYFGSIAEEKEIEISNTVNMKNNQ